MGKAAFLFAGQNSERKGMLNELYKESSIVRQTFEEASDLLGLNVAKICFDDQEPLIHDPSISAPVILTAQVASYQHIVNQEEIVPSLMAGHSLGEYGALTCAGVFDFKDALPLVAYRADLAKQMEYEKNGVMTVVYHFSYRESERICKYLRSEGRNVWISCYNSINQVTISGEEKDIDTLELFVAKQGGMYKRLIGKSPSHFPFLEEIINDLGSYIDLHCDIHPPDCPVISNYSVRPYTADSVKENLLKHLVFPVRWFQTIAYFKRQNVDTLIELGSGETLTGLVLTTETEIQAFSYEKTESRKQLNQFIVNG